VTTTAGKLNLKDHGAKALREILAERGLPPFRGSQIFRWVWRRNAKSVADMTDLPKELRESLAPGTEIPELGLSQKHVARDGTTKLLARLDDGREVETVIIPDDRRSSETTSGDSGPGVPRPGPARRVQQETAPDPDFDGDTAENEDAPEPGAPRRFGRRTLCISTQVGCAMGCTFCRTATMGLVRHLRPWEIAEQVLLAERVLKERGEGRIVHTGRGQAGEVERRLDNLVFMGMGEPLHNFEGTVEAIKILTDQTGLAFPARRITVSTVGLAEKIVPFLEAVPGARLAISLNASNDAARSAIMPINKKHSIGDLMAVVRALPLKKRERVTFEYVLLAGVTDEPAHARELAAHLRGLHDKVKLNLIPWNAHEGAPFSRPEPARVEAFRAILKGQGIQALLRRPRGDDVLAACGQLATDSRVELGR
jgi:23S rRNA (adenine2503-C2)-methyltransferase